MDADQPALRHADTDGIGPVKRRRPAFSCVECRKRKVKCDRGKPCGPCKRTKSPTCTFRPDPRTATERRRSSPVARIATVAASASTGHETTSSDRSTPHSSVRGDDLDASRSAPLAGSARTSLRQDLTDDLATKLRDLEYKLSTLTAAGIEQEGSVRPSRDAIGPDPAAARFVKSKFYGQSHWNNCLEPYNALGNKNITLNTDTNRTEINKSSDLYNTILECKRMARTIKASRMLQPFISSEVQESIPSRHICDQLVQNYLRTFEGVLRVLHVPTFLKDYETCWNNSAASKPSIVLKVLLVCAIGVPFYTGPEQPNLRRGCTKWVQEAESWLSAPHAKSRLNMTGLQIQILTLLARQVSSVDGDLVWMPAGALLRNAMHLGLHRDPSHFDKISTFHREMRRRLWATVMEITVQTSLDMGMPPMISPENYDTQPPSNINDEDISDGGPALLFSKPTGEFTKCSIQIAFYETLPLRLEVTRLINGFRSSLSYEDTIRLGSELLTACRQKTSFFQSQLVSSSETKPNVFQVKLFDSLVRRFFLCLHRPFFNKSKTEPKYYYSRKVCLDAAVAIAAPASHCIDDSVDDWSCLTYRAVGFMKSFFLHSLSVVYLELVSQLEEEQGFAPFAPLAATRVGRTPLSPQLEVYRDIIVFAREVAEHRLLHGETNAKGYSWLSCAIARVDALASGSNTDAAVLAAAKQAVAVTAEIMRTAYYEEHGVHMNLGLSHGPFAGKEHGRGEGADDVTGTHRNNGDDHGWGEQTGMTNDGIEDMDWGKLMQTEGMGVGWGFEESPEGWFGWGWEREEAMGW